MLCFFLTVIAFWDIKYASVFDILDRTYFDLILYFYDYKYKVPIFKNNQEKQKLRVKLKFFLTIDKLKFPYFYVANIKMKNLRYLKFSPSCYIIVSAHSLFF